MKQVKVFYLPEEINAANEFLSKVSPESLLTTEKAVMINYDDQTYPDGYKREEIMALMLSNEKQAMTSNISKRVTEIDLARIEADLAELKATVITVEGKEKYDNKKDKEDKVKAYEMKISNMKRAIEELNESITRAETKNGVLQEVLDTLKS